MTVGIAINGFGRIGRLVLRALVETGRDDLVPVAINDLGSIEANAHLFRYDSVHGRFPGQVEIDGDTLSIYYHGRSYGPIKVSAERDPTKVPIPWSRCRHGMHRTLRKEGCCRSAHHCRRAQVLVSAPAAGADATIVYGVQRKVDHSRHDRDLQRVLYDKLPGTDGKGRP